MAGNFRLSWLWVVLLVGCATYSSRISGPRSFFERGEYEPAVESLKPLVAREDADKLLYLMDLGLVYHTAGKYEDSVRVFLEAEKLSEITDYTSLTDEALSFMVREDAKTYKGEHFEKLLINVYLAIDYTMMHRWDDALVECRKVNHKIDRMIREGNLPYTHNAFAKYLAAVLFEAEKEYNDALVDYRQLLKWGDQNPYLPQPLLRISDKLKMSQEFAEFRKMFPSDKDYKIKKDEGEIVLLLEQGRSPIKVPSEQFYLLPRFERRSYSSQSASLNVAGKSVRSATLFDIESVAIQELDHRIALVAAKKVSGMVAKEIIAHEIEKKTENPWIGLLVRLFFYTQDRADTRSWTTLPATLQLARVTVPAGKHKVALDVGWRLGGAPTQAKVWEDVEIKPGQKVFLNYRIPD